jgi:bifunctional UDP-N-acetylglucosamine pyrophosphorylase/glucosamine-1-phosphate N-acetyltransferase
MRMPRALTVVVLAAGKGTRMRSPRPKVLHPVAGRSMLGHVLVTAAALAPERVVVVLAEGMAQVAAEVERQSPGALIVIQEPQLGTGHALMVARDQLTDRGEILVLYGDTPLITAATLERLLAARSEIGGAVAVMGFEPPDRAGYGRLMFDGAGLAAIVEERHADETLKRQGICNAGIMVIDGTRLGALLDSLELRQGKQEYYLTDIVRHARARGWPCTAMTAPWVEGIGVNSQTQLAEAEAWMQKRLRAAAMDRGVTLTAPEAVFLAFDTEFEPGVEVGPYVFFGPGVRVAAGARILPFCRLENVTIPAGAEVGSSPKVVGGPTERWN